MEVKNKGMPPPLDGYLVNSHETEVAGVVNNGMDAEVQVLHTNTFPGLDGGVGHLAFQLKSMKVSASR